MNNFNFLNLFFLYSDIIYPINLNVLFLIQILFYEYNEKFNSINKVLIKTYQFNCIGIIEKKAGENFIFYRNNYFQEFCFKFRIGSL